MVLDADCRLLINFSNLVGIRVGPNKLAEVDAGFGSTVRRIKSLRTGFGRFYSDTPQVTLPMSDRS